MTARTIAAPLAAAVLLALPAAAPARPAEPGGAVATGHPNAYALALDREADRRAGVRAAAPAGDDGGGDGTATPFVLAVAGGALLLGAASGFRGGRIVARRGAAGS